MPPKKSPTLTEAELRLMEVLWQKGPATVHQVLEALPEKFSLAYNSVLTTEATRFEIKNLLGRFFKNSHELLVLNILEDKSISADELKRLSQLLQEQRRKP